MLDLELVRVHWISDERNDREAAMETAVVDLAAWRLDVDGQIDNLRQEMKRLGTQGNRAPVGFPRLQSSLMSPTELVTMRLPAESLTDWP